MKKMLLASVVIAGLAVLGSCSKNYTCTCTSVLPDGTVTNTTKETLSGTKSSAENSCKQRDNVIGNTTTTCLID
jgi:hypothetical protein